MKMAKESIKMIANGITVINIHLVVLPNSLFDSSNSLDFEIKFSHRMPAKPLAHLYINLELN